VSDSNGPVRRRRIAGESGPTVPVARAKKIQVAKAKKPPVVKKTPVAAPKVEKVKVEKPRPPGSRPSRRDVLWLVPATLVAIAALVAGILLVVNPPGSDDSAKALDTSRRQASSAAASAAETIFTFRYDQLDQHLTASKALMTPAFSKQFDSIAPALTELAPQRKIVVQAVAREAAALPCGDECSASKAEVLVFVDQARLVGDSKEPTVFANRIKVSMVKSDDGWLVSNIRAL
jgi:Mce-associated membrane protein